MLDMRGGRHVTPDVGDGIIHMSRVAGLRYLQMGKLDAARREKRQDPRRRSVRRHSHRCSGGKERHNVD